MAKQRIKDLTFSIPLIDRGTACIIETSDLGEMPVLEYIDEDGRSWIFNWATGEYEPGNELSFWLG